MVASGLHKLQIKEWWNGLAPWFYLNAPFHTTPEKVQSYAPYAGAWLVFLSLCSYLALAWQLAFPAFAWLLESCSYTGAMALHGPHQSA